MSFLKNLFGGGDSKPKATQQEKALAERGVGDWNRYVSAYIPAEDSLLAQSGVNASDRSADAGRIAEGAAGSFAGPGTDISVVLGGGTNQNARAVGDLTDAYSAAVARGTSASDRAQKAREIRAKMRIASLGRGIADSSSLSLANAGAAATQASVDKSRRNLELSQALVSGAASGAGMYLGYQQGAEKPKT